MKFIRIAAPLAAAFALAAPVGASAAETGYPCATIRFVSPYPPGGTTDILARLLAPGMAKELGTTVIVENRGGASSNIGTEFVATSPPDGCTLLLGNNTGVVINRNLYKLRVDPAKGLAPVGAVASVPLVLYVNSTLPVKTVGELVDYASKNPGKLSYASGGSGSPQHLMGELLKLERHLDIVHVPYKGQGPAMQDVVAGQVPMAFETTAVIVPQLASGRVRALATTGKERSKDLPSVPTMKELGFPTFVTENWYGVFAPARTPQPLVQRLNAALTHVLKTSEVSTKLAQLGSTDMSDTPEHFGKFIDQELPYWESIVKRSGAKVD